MDEIRANTAYGRDAFVIVDDGVLGFKLVKDEAQQLADLGVRITDATNATLGFDYPENPEWLHILFCLFVGPLEQDWTSLLIKSVVAIQPRKIDRPPTGIVVSARMALSKKETCRIV